MVMMSQRVTTNPKGNQRDRILDILRDRSDRKGYVSDTDVALIARLTGIDDHDVAKQLWGLQKAGLIGFSVKKGHGQSWPYRFRLRKRLLADTQPEQDSAGLGDRAAHAITAPTGRAHRMGPDVLDPATAARKQRTEAGPVTTRRHSVPEPTERPSEAREPGAGIRGPKATGTPTEAVPSRWQDDYPQIAAVMARRDRVAKTQAAAKALEEAGLDDLAIQALEAVPSFTPLEAEIIRLMEDIAE